MLKQLSDVIKKKVKEKSKGPIFQRDLDKDLNEFIIIIRKNRLMRSWFEEQNIRFEGASRQKYQIITFYNEKGEAKVSKLVVSHFQDRFGLDSSKWSSRAPAIPATTPPPLPKKRKAPEPVPYAELQDSMKRKRLAKAVPVVQEALNKELVAGSPEFN